MDYTIDGDKVRIGDLRTIDRVQRGVAPISEVIDILDRCVVGGVDEIPARHYRPLMERVLAVFAGEDAEAKNS